MGVIGGVELGYFSLTLGYNIPSASFWDLVVGTVYKYLVLWEKPFFPEGGISTLIQFFLSSFPCYFFFLFRVLVSEKWATFLRDIFIVLFYFVFFFLKRKATSLLM